MICIGVDKGSKKCNDLCAISVMRFENDKNEVITSVTGLNHYEAVRKLLNQSIIPVKYLINLNKICDNTESSEIVVKLGDDLL
jgi:hypothetical protein